MLIKRLEVNNFRQFKGKQVIEFSTDEQRNITLVLGDNTSGKTTLLQSFLWCLYGKANFKTRDILLNQMAVNELINSPKEQVDTISVSINLIHDDHEYTITRKQKYYGKSGTIRPDSITLVTVMYKEKDGQSVEIKPYHVQEKINEILPEDLSTYFLYDTERFGNITTKSDVSEAVKGLLGLTVLENIQNHIGKETRKDSVLGQFRSSIVEREDEKANEALEKVHNAEDEKGSLEERITKLDVELQYYYDKKEKAQIKLRELKSSSELQSQKENIEKKVKDEGKNLESKEKFFLKSFHNRSFLFFAQPLLKKALEKLHNADVSDKGIRDMNANSINQIIERGYCLCGTSIVEGETVHKNLLEEMSYLPPQSLGVMINNYQETSNSYLESINEFYPVLNEAYRDILKIKRIIGEYNEEIKYLNEQLESSEDSGKYQAALVDAESHITNIVKQIGASEKSIETCSAIIKENKEKYESLNSTSEKNKEIRLYMAYAQELYNWAATRYSSKEVSIREELESKVNLYFNQIYHGERKVEIDSMYRVHLKTVSDSREITTDESQGLETVKNFAFIAGLVDLAKSKFHEETESEMDSEAAAFPLILDAPFSNADETHVANISKVLPKVAEQLIMIVMAKDWNYAEEQLEDKVGRRYQLVKESEIHTVIKEVVG